MNRVLLLIIGIFLIIYGGYSIYAAYKGGPMRGVISPAATIIGTKLFGEKDSNRFFNLGLGIIELIFGVLILMGKFF